MSKEAGPSLEAKKIWKDIEAMISADIKEHSLKNIRSPF
jgi:hypothetical protein